MLHSRIKLNNVLHSVSIQKLTSLIKFKFSTTSSLGKKNICIVGSGPAALYTAQYLIKNSASIEKSIDIYEKLPVPFGLVRYGVRNGLLPKILLIILSSDK